MSLVISFLAFRRDSHHLTVRFRRNLMPGDLDAAPLDRMVFRNVPEDERIGTVLDLAGNAAKSTNAVARIACVTVINDGRRANRVKTCAFVTKEMKFLLRTGWPMKELAEGQHCDYELSESVLDNLQEPLAAVVVDISTKCMLQNWDGRSKNLHCGGTSFGETFDTRLDLVAGSQGVALSGLRLLYRTLPTTAVARPISLGYKRRIAQVFAN